MTMTASEIREKYKRNGSNKQYKEILAELNGVTTAEIQSVLDGNDLGIEKPKRTITRPKLILSGNLKKRSAKKPPEADGIMDVLIKEAVVCYICSLREDNERLRGLQNRQGKYGRKNASVENRIEVNEQKIDILKRWHDGK